MSNESSTLQTIIKSNDKRRFDLLGHLVNELPQEVERESKNFFGPYFKFVTQDFGSWLRELRLLPILDKSGDKICDPIEIKKLDKENMRQYVNQVLENLQDAELIGIDESKNDNPIFSTQVNYLKSIAYRLYLGHPEAREIIDPIVINIRLRMESEEIHKAKTDLTTYLNNLFVTLVVMKKVIAQNHKISAVFIHGPIIRPLGPFEDIVFTFEELSRMLRIANRDEKGNEIDIGDERIKDYAVNYQSLKNLHNNFCQNCKQPCENIKNFPDYYTKGILKRVLEHPFDKRGYPGICVYFMLLREIYDLCLDHNILLVACPEAVERGSEFLRMVFPNLYLKVMECNLDLTNIDALITLMKIKISKVKRGYAVSDLLKFLRRQNLADAPLLTFALEDGEYITPIPIRRYQSKESNHELLSSAYDIGVNNVFQRIVDLFLPQEKYKFMMSFIRTTPLKEPLRIEFPYNPNYTIDQIAKIVYVLSLPYRSYGMPIVLYYADKLARTPEAFIKAVSNRAILKIMQNELGEVTLGQYWSLEGFFARNFYRR